MRLWPLVFVVAALAGFAGPSERGAEAGERITPAPAAATVIGLRRAGWVVTGQRERLERRPGLPPYETLDRQVHITTFVLEKNGRRKRRTLAYDSQLDTFAEDCRDAE